MLGAVVAAIFLSASVPRLDRVDKLELLGGGQDWLTHESFARDILIGGPLMTLGKPLGEGRTFYAQPFYPYALAAMHALTGEDQFGVLALQVFGSGVAGVLLYYLARRLFGTGGSLGDVRPVPAALVVAPGVGGVPSDLRGDLLRDPAGPAAGAGALPGRAPTVRLRAGRACCSGWRS